MVSPVRASKRISCDRSLMKNTDPPAGQMRDLAPNGADQSRSPLSRLSATMRPVEFAANTRPSAMTGVDPMSSIVDNARPARPPAKVEVQSTRPPFRNAACTSPEPNPKITYFCETEGPVVPEALFTSASPSICQRTRPFFASTAQLVASLLTRYTIPSR